MIALLVAAQITVFAASSLREAFTEIASRFEKQNGARVALQFAGSQELRVQIENGASGDVFASADEKQMNAVRSFTGEPRIFARNELVVVVPEANPAKLRSFEDLPKAQKIVLAAAEVPVGAYADEAIAARGAAFRAAVEARVVSRELNVRQVLSKVALDEADAGIVYRTDARATAKVDVFPIPGAPVALYPIAQLSRAPSPELARKFVALVLSPEGQEALRRHGFLPPP